MTSRRVLKYRLEVRPGPQEVTMPWDSWIANVHDQALSPTMWVMVGGSDDLAVPAEPTVVRRFYVFGTGHEIDPGLHYVGTAHCGAFVWHVFEEINE